VIALKAVGKFKRLSTSYQKQKNKGEAAAEAVVDTADKNNGASPTSPPPPLLSPPLSPLRSLSPLSMVIEQDRDRGTNRKFAWLSDETETAAGGSTALQGGAAGGDGGAGYGGGCGAFSSVAINVPRIETPGTGTARMSATRFDVT
jgi:hypothetical protein